jgi:glycosyltransferase involved in cell wall biosynthesis
VLAQTFTDYEIVVVDDGSAPEHRPAYDTALAQAGERATLHRLVHRSNGHGQSYSLNFGVSKASGAYIAILDDDDVWTDPGHLARAAAALEATPADLYMTNQRPYRQGQPVERPHWLGTLAPRLAAEGRKPRADGCLPVTIADLIPTQGFCHVNCLIVRRGLWDSIGGMDEGIRWECDRDLYVRLIDHASGPMLHHPAVTARHNIPDPAKTANMTTALPMLHKRLHQLRALDKAALFGRHSEIRAEARVERGYTLKKMSEELAGAGDWPAAAHYARAALGSAPTAGWFALTAWYETRSLASRLRPRG